jgi:2-polyprenyl-3-methyl-5-hydroxy-6-metoxy-1,4-benzoquinol methylase
MDDHKKDEGQRNRFAFGKNWQRFLSVLNEERISEAEKSLKQMLEIDNLKGKSFLDVGSGSGLFSLAAKRLGARVYSFDYDPFSVSCTMELKKQYFPNDLDWSIELGDVLNISYLNSLGKFDVVYAWGVLHHTGSMWVAIRNVTLLVNEGGKLFISIYNDQGILSLFWKGVKLFYNRSPKPIRVLIVLCAGVLLEIGSVLVWMVRWQNAVPFKYWFEKKRNRGMSVWHDLVDWVGGYPFEVARPKEILDFVKDRKFELVKLKMCTGGSGCNEFIFFRKSD